MAGSQTFDEAALTITFTKIRRRRWKDFGMKKDSRHPQTMNSPKRREIIRRSAALFDENTSMIDLAVFSASLVEHR